MTRAPVFRVLPRFRRKARSLLLSLLVLCSCAVKRPAVFPLYSPGQTPALYGASKEAAAGRLELADRKPERVRPLRYHFEPPLAVPAGYSLEFRYRLGAPYAPVEAPLAALELGGESWTLPGGAAYLGLRELPFEIRYAAPVQEGALQGFTLRFLAGPGEERFPPGLAFELRSLALIPRWYGFIRPFPGEAALSLTPFVSLEADALVIDPGPRYRAAGELELTLTGPLSLAAVEGGGAEIEYRLEGGPPFGRVQIPPVLLSRLYWPLQVSTDAMPDAMELAAPPDRPFPLEPVPADPGIVLSYPQDAWRDARYEVFRWTRFSSILIFDTADYRVQERLFKRLAFFVEKAGYRGRLLSDREMEGLHGWNAHDYSAEDLAAFFEAAGEADFPLSSEERELLAVLLYTGVIAETGAGLRAGEGAVISVSRESSAALRTRFMTHEGFHGIFFIDQDFRDFSRSRWDALDPQAKAFLRSYFEYMRYDVQESSLVVNEFMAYCLQQPVSQAGGYFGNTLAGVIAASWRASVLPDDPSLLSRVLSAEAAAFSRYVNRRWGLEAGRIHSAVIR